MLVISTPVLMVSQATAAEADISQSVTQSYNAGEGIQTGMAVRLKDGSKDTVVPLEKKKVKDLLGVVVPAGASPVVLSPDKVSAPQVLVARKGVYKLLVSNQNGAVKKGDLITVSDAPGIGMKSVDGTTALIGKAAEAFDGQNNSVGNATLKAGSESRVVGIGRISVDLNAPYNPAYAQQAAYVPGFLANAAAGLAGKPVSAARIYLALVVLGIAAFLSGSLLAGGVRGGLVAIGRNPLSKRSIFRGIAQTATLGLGIFVIGVFAVYLLLKL